MIQKPVDAPQFIGARRLHPTWMKALDAFGRLIPKHGRIEPEVLWSRATKAVARAATPASGPPPASVASTIAEPSEAAKEALQVLADSICSEARLSWVGRLAAKGDTLRLAETHLRIRHALETHPQIATTSLPPPVFIVGMPRTGTTFLHQLLAQDPAHRTLPYWESFDPVPPASGPDRRPQKVERMLRQLDALVPEIQAIHPMTAEMPEECVALFMNEFRTLQLDIQYRVPRYADWLLHEDAAIAYGAYREQLQIILHHRPGGERLLLKDPTHTLHLATLLDVFPDARVIYLHRDPLRSISSICSLYAYTRSIFSEFVDPVEIGREILDGYWPEGLFAAQRVRERIAKGCVADARQQDLVENPLAVVASIYDALGFEWTEAARQAMGRFLEAKRTTPRAKHEHRLEGFGLTEAAVRERFKAYCETFDV